MITHADILKLYKEYVNSCIESTTDEDLIYPTPFVIWKRVVYDPMEDRIMKQIGEHGESHEKEILRGSSGRSS